MFSLLFAIILPTVALADSIFTIFNSCAATINPTLLQGVDTRQSLGSLASGATTKVTLKTNFSGVIFSDSGEGESAATKAAFELSGNFYYILIGTRFDHGISIFADGPQKEGFCLTAICTSANCTDAFHTPPSLPPSNSTRAPAFPLQQCVGSNTAYTVTFCPGEALPPAFQIHPNGNKAKCLDVRGAKLANGTPVQIFDCNGTGAQKWVINNDNTMVQLADTNFCLDAGTAPANNVGMKIWTCFDNLPAQAWFYTGDKRIAVTGKGQCLDLTDGHLTNGNRVQTYHCTRGNTNQIWTTTPF